MPIFEMPPGERERCAIFGQDYGQAGAIHFFGAKMGLPPLFPDRRITTMGDPRVYRPVSMPSQHFDVELWRRPKFGNLPQLWPKRKNWR
jgi:hypothetical protein